jgi:hypothetical protein
MKLFLLGGGGCFGGVLGVFWGGCWGVFGWLLGCLWGGVLGVVISGFCCFLEFVGG